MKRLSLILYIMCFTLSLQAQVWNWTFHPGDKIGLPNRYACQYEDMECIIILRSDLPYVRIELKNDSFITYKNDIQEDVTSIDVHFYSPQTTTYITTMTFEAKLLNNKICVIENQDFVDYIIKEHKLKIQINKTKILKINNFSVDKNYLSMIYFIEKEPSKK